MIKTVAELLKAFVDEERAKLDAEELIHGPTIGAMYEGLTKETVEKSLPEGLDLRVVPGFAFFGDKISGELDCMLVRGEELKLTTLKCEAVCIGGNFYAGENNSGLLTKWIEHRLGKRMDETNILVIRGDERWSHV